MKNNSVPWRGGGGGGGGAELRGRVGGGVADRDRDEASGSPLRAPVYGVPAPRASSGYQGAPPELLGAPPGASATRDERGLWEARLLAHLVWCRVWEGFYPVERHPDNEKWRVV